MTRAGSCLLQLPSIDGCTLMALEIGIVGPPNSGKSTVFNALMKSAQAEASRHPFGTIEPNVGVVEVPDDRLQRLAEIAKPGRIVPATVRFTDIAGLAKDAHLGAGLGNRFLADVRACQAIAIVIRCFEDPDVMHPEGRVDPASDLDTILLELMLSDLSVVSTREHSLEKEARGRVPGAKEKLDLLLRIKASLEQGVTPDLSSDERDQFKDLGLISLKEKVVIANLGEDQVAHLDSEPHYLALQAKAREHGLDVIPIPAQVEAELAALSDEEAREYLASLGREKTGLDQLIEAGFRMLNLIVFFTAGPMEVRAWEIRKGAKAPEAAGRVHSDLQRGFIRAEVISYEDYVRYGGEHGAKEAGKLRLEGKEYVVQDGDVIHVRFKV